MLHLRQWQNEVITECARFDLRPWHCGSILPETLIRRACQEYEVCDKIVVLSSVARQSFEHFGQGNKAVVIWPSVDHTFFTPSMDSGVDRLFRACYVGRMEIAMGVGCLLEAWKRLGLRGAELVLVGEIQPEIHALLTKYMDPSVKLKGLVSPEEVAVSYQQSRCRLSLSQRRHGDGPA
jgi:glycosyltransferase involved in cell wall biosynthesis